MKLMLPVAGMVVAAGSCCCCGLDPQALFEQLQQTAEDEGMPAIGGADDAEGADEPADEPTGEPDVAPATGTTEGLCGRYQSDGLTLPSGFKVIGCTTAGGTESLLAMGSTPPKEVCTAVRAWAFNAGWNVESEVDMSGTVALSLKKGSDRMSLSCTDSTGQTSVAVSITAG